MILSLLMSKAITYQYNNLMIFLELLMKKEKVKEVLQEILRRHSQDTQKQNLQPKNENKNNETIKPQTKQ